MLIVTCAIVIRESKILICQRSSTMNLPLKWEFPGGKVEPGEDDAATVVREISEELHLDIEVVKRLGPVEHDYPTFRIRLVPFIAHVVGGELLLEEHVDAKWVAVDVLDRYDWAPADVPIVEQLKTLAIWN
ncbi:(deoxy)nucleoside triphosphate pyrophosphohydrolase [Parapedobacter sp. 10938]|uniref:(deoxy)nucleoside triphosphate pyrophosphohydrolase n=1 Tax=Parapedobacter flavus TaxID=3110225 RepID=UPI002DBBF122|nr:(deoxy)nucleoside triphosphate pyrophosphohydrolase [Parapedobacter sp. 10938]MEC3881926.1 (deoxy)nucleoside triphosphate pyrophosphohydrolase [Parapedobacter sp. 10938]